MIWFVSRHPGAVEWALRQGLSWDVFRTHLDAEAVRAGDRVLGTLPPRLAADVCAAGAEYWHLEVPMRADWRGRELSADQLETAGARLVRFEVRRVET